MGPLLVLAALGAVRTARQAGAAFCVTYLACLGFLTLSWIMRSSLGLDRHFVVVVPAYATMAANGVAEIAARTRSLARRAFRHSERAPRIAGAAAIALLGACVLVGALSRLGDWMRDWRASIERGWPDRLAVGAFLRTLPGSSTIFCDESTVEILSGLDRRRFDRHWVDDPTEPDRIRGAARHEGAVYVATWMRKLKTLRGVGEIVYRPPGEADEAKGLGVLRCDAR